MYCIFFFPPLLLFFFWGGGAFWGGKNAFPPTFWIGGSGRPPPPPTSGAYATMWLSCIRWDVFVGQSTLIVGQALGTTCVFLWPWMSDKVSILRIILIIFRIYRMRHTSFMLTKAKHNTWNNEHFQYNPNNFATLHFDLAPIYSPYTRASEIIITNQAAIKRRINRLSSDM